jgi:hypothetical protein
MPKPELTEIERLKLENFTLRHITFEAQLRQNQLDRAVFLKSLEETYPGWRWQDPEGLVEVAEPRKAEPVKEPYPEMTRH